jgi:hypothetical protein
MNTGYYIIRYSLESYPDGDNLLFQIYFKKYNKTTQWFGDNGEWGCSDNVRKVSKLIAEWFLSKPDRISMIGSNVSESKFKFLDEFNKFLNSLK